MNNIVQITNFDLGGASEVTKIINKSGDADMPSVRQQYKIITSTMLGSDNIYFFTRAMVDKIISKGYSDEDEEQFVYVAKNELVIEGDMNSVGYAPEEEAKRITEEIRGGR